MAYILVLNPLILSGAKDKFGEQFDPVQLTTALVAAVMTIVMGDGGNLPLALAAGLGLNAVVAFQIAPLMGWDDAMGLIVLEGLLICVLVVTGLREAVMHAIPQALKQAIGVGLFVAFIGFAAYVLIQAVLGRAKEIHWLLWGTSALFLVYFAIDPIEQILGVK